MLYYNRALLDIYIIYIQKQPGFFYRFIKHIKIFYMSSIICHIN